MKKLKILLISLALILITVFIIDTQLNKKVVLAPNGEADNKKLIELCFAHFSQPNERGYYDRYTLRMLLDNDNQKVNGELNFLPGEKDSKVGKFSGTVTPVDKKMMARTVDAMWDTWGEGIRATEEIKIIFGEGTASLGAGELVDRGDGVYIYKDPENLQYGFSLTDISCADLNERENVDKYIRANISKLSPVNAVLGGTWYVLSATVDVNNNSGVVMYEDGHIQEKRNYTYTTDSSGAIINLTIK